MAPSLAVALAMTANTPFTPLLRPPRPLQQLLPPFLLLSLLIQTVHLQPWPR